MAPPAKKSTSRSAYQPYANTRRPGGKPDYKPQYRVPEGLKVNILRGAAGRPQEPGFSRTVHWRVPGSAARLDYQHHAGYTGGSKGDPHPVVRIVAISFSSH